jgi:hypothetical protein
LFQSPKAAWNVDSILNLIPEDTLKDRLNNSPQGGLNGRTPIINMRSVSHYKITRTSILDSSKTRFLVEVRFYDVCNYVPGTPPNAAIDSSKYYVHAYEVLFDGSEFLIIPGWLVEGHYLNLEYYFECCKTGPEHELEKEIAKGNVDYKVYHR